LSEWEWGDKPNYYRETVKQYTTTELNVVAVVRPQIDDVTAASAPTASGAVREYLCIICGKSHMLQGTSQPGSSHVGIGRWKPK